MRILFFGDIIGKPGREAIKTILPQLRKKYDPDLIIANGENLAHGKGISEKTLNEVIEAGVDFFTSGNHVWEGKDAKTLLDNKNIPIIRPANYPLGVPGRGYEIIEIRTSKVLVINLIGRVFMHIDPDDPFRKVDQILEDLKEEAKIIIVDFHSEATSEKTALGWYLDGRVSAVLGTHTHVPTADLKILSKGTAFVSDIGMVGPRNSVIGVDTKILINHFLTQLSAKMEPAEGDVEVDAIYLEIDNRRGLAKKVERIQEIVSEKKLDQ